uniref:Serine/threonine-protein kinase mig-15 n=1 Tax=Steinernema glaseri TaxID=37863 RepID=A0A1I7YIK5_9BILA
MKLHKEQIPESPPSPAIVQSDDDEEAPNVWQQQLLVHLQDLQQQQRDDYNRLRQLTVNIPVTNAPRDSPTNSNRTPVGGLLVTAPHDMESRASSPGPVHADHPVSAQSSPALARRPPFDHSPDRDRPDGGSTV